MALLHFLLIITCYKVIEIHTLQCSVSRTNYHRFASMFRTPKQQEEFQKAYFELLGESNVDDDYNLQEKLRCVDRCFSKRVGPSDISLSDKFDSGKDYSDTEKTNPQKLAKKTTYATQLGRNFTHGCCNSQPYFIMPEEATTMADITQITVTVAQISELGQFQYFPTETCEQVDKVCSGCRCLCTSYPNVHTAVIINNPVTSCSNYYGLANIILPGCCKCTKRFN